MKKSEKKKKNKRISEYLNEEVYRNYTQAMGVSNKMRLKKKKKVLPIKTYEEWIGI